MEPLGRRLYRGIMTSVPGNNDVYTLSFVKYWNTNECEEYIEQHIGAQRGGARKSYVESCGQEALGPKHTHVKPHYRYRKQHEVSPRSVHRVNRIMNAHISRMPFSITTYYCVSSARSLPCVREHAHNATRSIICFSESLLTCRFHVVYEGYY